MSFQTSALLLSWVAILLLALVVSGLVRQVHALTSGSVTTAAGLRTVGLPAGTPAPRYDRLGPGPVVLLFAGTDCRTCASLLPQAAALAGPGATLRVLYPAAVPAWAPPAGGAVAGVHGDAADLFGAYGVLATPFGVLVDAEGSVRESVPLGSVDALRRLLRAAEEVAEVRKGAR